MTSTVLLQQFMIGLYPDIGRELLLKKKASDFSTTQKDTVDIEYALEFHKSRSPLSLQMQSHSARVWKHLPSTWTHWKPPHYREHKNIRPHPILQGNSVDIDKPLNQGYSGTSVGPCYNCGQVGHFHWNCPLNSYGPAP